MAHDPKAQDVIADALDAYWWNDRAAERILDALTDAGLCVVSDAAEPLDLDPVFRTHARNL